MIPYMPVRSSASGDHGGEPRHRLLSFLSADRRRLRPGPLEHALDHLALHALTARLAFPVRFDRAAIRLMRDGGRAVSPQQSAAYFGARLFITVDPTCLTHRLDEKFLYGDRRYWVGEYFLDAGDWRNILSPLDHSPAHREIIEICRTRGNFRDGEQYRKYARTIGQARPPRRNGTILDTIEKLDAYFSYYVDLIENIERTGILPRNRFQRADEIRRRHRSTRSFWRDLVERDIGVAIDSNGRMVRHTSGKHRLAAAIGLGIERVPVEIRMVHTGWLERQMQCLQLPPAQALARSLENAGFGHVQRNADR